jgi:DMSO/TMAO reductase YedYZ molybdopterin-dependent catalytic subunit
MAILRPSRVGNSETGVEVMTRSHEVSGSIPVLDRRAWLRWAALAQAATLLPLGCSRRPEAVSDATPADAPMRFPGKVPMRALNDRPPLLETPWDYFRHDLTPNEAFFVRWHLELIPTSVDLRSWRLKVAGHVERPLELSLDELRRMEPDTVVAVNQCSGNSRSQFTPRVSGGPGTAMPPWKGKLSAADRRLLASYVRTLYREQ